MSEWSKLKIAELGGDSNRDFMSAIFELSPIPHFLLDGDELVDVNHAALEVFGVREKSDVLCQKAGVFFTDFQSRSVHASDRLKEATKSTMEAGLFREELVLKKIGGEEFPAELTLQKINLADRELMLGTIRDLTRVREIEMRLDEERRRIESVINNVPGVFYRCTLDDERTMMFVSRDVQALTGYPASDFMESAVRTYTGLIHPDDLEAIRKAIREGVESLRPFEVRYRLFRRDGNVRTVYERGVAEYDFDTGDVKWLDGFAVDITDTVIQEEETKRLELELERQRLNSMYASKMASLGEMAGGVSHEINNPLTIIEGLSARLKRMIERGEIDHERMRSSVIKIQQTVKRIAGIVRGLKNFSRDGSEDPMEPCFVKTLIQESLDFCQERFRCHGVRIHQGDIDAGLQIFGRSVEISQVLINLFNNSFDAVQKLDEQWIRVEVDEKKDFVDLHIIDSGKGIDPSIRDRIMEPFFTTKDVGEGTGLGLGICKGIVDAHGGDIFCDPKKENTTFIVSLPKVTVSED